MTTSAAPRPPHTPHSEPKLPSLLEDLPPAPGLVSSHQAGAPRVSPSRDMVMSLGNRLRRHKRLAISLAVLLAIGGGIGLYFALRPTPQPDFLDDDMDLVLNYALLTDDFNHLPLDERLALITDLVERLKNMSSSDSAMMAMFASTIEAKARKQLTENMSRLAIDIWDKYAVEYDDVPTDGRGEYLDETFVEFTRMMESIGGEQSNKTDEQRLEEVRRQADRDRKAIESGKFNPPAQALGRVFEFMNFEVGGNASPQQRSRGQLMMRDMMRHFRGEEVNAEGKPAAPAPGDAPAEGDEPTKEDKPAEPEPK